MRRRNRTGKEENVINTTLSLVASHDVYAIFLHTRMASGFPVVGRETSIDEYKLIIKKVKRLKNEECSIKQKRLGLYS